MPDIGDWPDVGQLERWVGRRLNENQPRPRIDRGHHRFRPRGLDKAPTHSEAFEHALEEPEGAAIDNVGNNDLVAALQQSEEECRNGRHAGGKADRARRAFELGNGYFQLTDGGVGCTAVSEAFMLAKSFLDKGG